MEVVGPFECVQHSLQPIHGALVNPVALVSELVGGRECEGGTDIAVVATRAEVLSVE